MDLDLEITHKTVHLFDLGIGDQLDIGMLAHINHFRGTDTGGTVQGGKGLIILEHMITHSRALFDQINLIASLGNIQGGL
ncbi:MAG: hypothetical protein D3908_08790, partial [Candidatus Electrothrix sp. AUS4]|nr:hypothetical protein [Candidatus Electrothrix sp. AUS4]